MRNRRPTQGDARRTGSLWHTAKRAAREATIDFFEPLAQIARLVRRLWNSWMRR
jgi:hypothetical protein